ncbi:MAG: hypothetical protein LBH19_05265 [Dysgonamonadaceae bacterium]|jgi:hypothetical protein|nr:hypothetical protein [Dysgonamonadaceae bacterium]
MISDNITKQDFVVRVLERDVKNIYKAQLLIAQENAYVSGRELKLTKRKGKTIGVRTGSLSESLRNPDYVIQAEGEKFIISAGIVKHMRFLDMKEHGNWKIYNRQVWGILYNNSLKDIRYNYGNSIADYIGDLLHNAGAFFPEHGKSSGQSFGEQYSEVKKR